MIDRITVEGFTSIVEADIDLQRLNVLVGANGAGKSNLVRAFELLGRIVDQDLRVHVARNGGASLLLNTSSHAIRLIVISGLNDADGNTYEARLEPSPDDGLFFAAERAWTDPHPGQLPVPGLGRGHKETRLHKEAARQPAAGPDLLWPVVDLLRGCRVFHFHDTGARAVVKAPVATADNLELHPDASNLAAVLLHLRDSDHPVETAAYRRVVGAIKQVAPFFRDFVLEPESKDRVRLRWREADSDQVFSAHQMSDGTLRFVCLATLLLQPELPALVVLDEPELGLHPFAIFVLADLLRQASTRSQLVIATQSVTLINQFDVEDLIVVDRGSRGSTFSRPDPEKLREWLDDYSLGEIWEKNLIGGRPGSVAGLADG